MTKESTELSQQYRAVLGRFGFELVDDQYVAIVPDDYRASRSVIARGIAPIVKMMEHFETTGEVKSGSEYDTNGHRLSVSCMTAAELRVLSR